MTTHVEEKITRIDLIKCIIDYKSKAAIRWCLTAVGILTCILFYWGVDNLLTASYLFYMCSESFKDALYYTHHSNETIKEYIQEFGYDTSLKILLKETL